MSAFHKNRLFPIAFIFFLATLFFYPVIIQGKTFFAFDTLLQHLPWSSLIPNYRVHNPLISDPVNMLYLCHYFIKAGIKLKSLPIWDGSAFCGVPFSFGYTPLANPIALLSGLVFPITVAHDVILWLHLFGAGVFMFLYLSAIELKTYPALIGAVSWMFKGYVMVFFEIESAQIIASTLPAILFFFEKWLFEKTRLCWMLFIGAVALSINSGYTNLIIYQTLFVFAYLSYRLAADTTAREAVEGFVRKNHASFTFGIILLGLLSANFIVSHLAFLDDPQRVSMSFKNLYEQTGQLPAKYLITLIFPNFYGNPAGGLFYFPPGKIGTQPYNNYSELCIYAGVLTLFLALATLPYIFKRKHIPFFFLTGLLALTMAMGSTLYYPFASYVPGLNFSSPTRIIYIFGFCVSILSAIGADLIFTAQGKKKGAILVIWVVMLSVVLMVAACVQTDWGRLWAAESVYWLEPHKLLDILKDHFSFVSEIILSPLNIVFASFLSLSAALIIKKSRTKTVFLFLGLIVLSYDLMIFGWKYNTTTPKHLEYPETEAIRFLKKDASLFRIITFGQFMHNSFAPFGISDVGGYYSFYPKRYGEYLHLSQNGPDMPVPNRFSRWVNFTNFGSPLFDIINTKYILLPPSAKVAVGKLRPVYNGEINIFENRDAFPRFFFAHDYLFCDTRKTAYHTLSTFRLSDFKKKVILESFPPADFKKNEGAKDKGPAPSTAIQLLLYQPTRIKLSVSTEKRGFLVISDSYHPAWKVAIDGKPSQILRANYIMRAIPIPAGNHEVELTFRPGMVLAGMLFTAIGWIILPIMVTREAMRGKKLLRNKNEVS